MEGPLDWLLLTCNVACKTNIEATYDEESLVTGPNQLLNGNQEHCVLQLCSEGRGRIMR